MHIWQVLFYADTGSLNWSLSKYTYILIMNVYRNIRTVKKGLQNFLGLVRGVLVLRRRCLPAAYSQNKKRNLCVYTCWHLGIIFATMW